MKFTQKQIERWSLTRKDGKTHYALTRGLFGLGAPLLIGGTLIQLWMAPNQNIYSLLGSLLVMIPGCLYIGYRCGRKQWDTYEKQYALAEGQASTPIPETQFSKHDVSSRQSLNQSIKSPLVSEEGFYEIVATELEQQTHKASIWTKAFADADGHPERARALYIRYRVAQLTEASNREQQEYRQTIAEATRQRRSAGFHRFIYGLMAFVCGILCLFFALGVAVLFSHDKVGGGFVMVVLAVLFGFGTYRYTKASQG